MRPTSPTQGGCAAASLPDLRPLTASLCRGVVLLHRWLNEHAGRGGQFHSSPDPPRAASAPQRRVSTSGTPTILFSRQEVLDRYKQHTRDCPSWVRRLHPSGRPAQRRHAALRKRLALLAQLPPLRHHTMCRHWAQYSP